MIFKTNARQFIRHAKVSYTIFIFIFYRYAVPGVKRTTKASNYSPSTIATAPHKGLILSF
jgi:hypothetical protein